MVVVHFDLCAYRPLGGYPILFAVFFENSIYIYVTPCKIIKTCHQVPNLSEFPPSYTVNGERWFINILAHVMLPQSMDYGLAMSLTMITHHVTRLKLFRNGRRTRTSTRCSGQNRVRISILLNICGTILTVGGTEWILKTSGNSWSAWAAVSHSLGDRCSFIITVVPRIRSCIRARGGQTP